MIRGAAGRLKLPFDTYERHAVVASVMGAPGALLDVGARPGELEQFLPGTQVATVNVDEPADVLYDGKTLPFPDDSFDAVTSLDVLEHLPRMERRAHLEELVRVAQDRVVACCPLGTPAHVEAERALAARYPHDFLTEHIEHGLPSEEELRTLVAGLALPFELRFHGDFRTASELFALGKEARSGPRGLVAYGVRRLRWRPDLRLEPASNPFTNRAYLIGEG